MKYLIASDLHGSAEYVARLMDAWAREGADRLLLLGDLLYHGPRNDLPDDYKFYPDWPHIKSVCVDDLKFNTDFEYEYEGGLVVYCGEVMTEEAARR